jgi:hypothetical protein
MITEVVEMPDFIRRAKALMSDAERMELFDVLARDPKAGVSLGQGLYKVRFGRTGEGESGGSGRFTSSGRMQVRSSC